MPRTTSRTRPWTVAAWTSRARELDDALELYAAAGDEARYLSALGNRTISSCGRGTRLRRGRCSSAFSPTRGQPDGAIRSSSAIPAAQEIALLDGDAAAAAAAFREGRELAAGADAAHRP